MGPNRNLESPTSIAIGGATNWTRPQRQHLRRMLAVLPEAQEHAYNLTEYELCALRGAWSGRFGWRVEETYAAQLFPEGLCDRAGYLTAFGYAVRAAAMREDA